MNSSLRSRVERLVELRSRPLPPALRVALLCVALAAFVAFVALALWQRPDDDRAVVWPALAAAALVLGPATVALKGAEYITAARLVERRATWDEAIDVAVMGAAANLLPVPGSMMVTTYSLSAGGSTIGRSAASVATVGLTWLGVSVSVGGLVIILAGRGVTGLIVLGLGLAFAVAATITIRGRVGSGRRMRAGLAIVGIETLFLAVAVARLGLVAYGIGVDTDWWRLAAFPMAAALGTAVGFVPAGLGIREGIMALVSPAVGLSVADGLLLGVVDRVLWLMALALCTAVALGRRAITRGRRTALPPSDQAPADASASAPREGTVER